MRIHRWKDTGDGTYLVLLYFTVNWTQGTQGVSREAGRLRNHRNCRQVYSLRAGAAAVLQPCCIPWWLTQRTQPKCSLHSFSGRAYIYLQSKSGLWPSRYIFIHMCSAISDLSCYTTMYLQNVAGERETVGRESLTTAILPNLLFPYISIYLYLDRGIDRILLSH